MSKVDSVLCLYSKKTYFKSIFLKRKKKKNCEEYVGIHKKEIKRSTEIG